MLIEQIKENAERDLQWELENADDVSIRIAALKEKYCRILMNAEFEERRLSNELHKVYKKRHEYYMQDYPVAIDRRDVDMYIKGDEEYVAANNRVETVKVKIKYIEGILKGIDSMSFNIGNAIKWHIFKAGGV